MGTKWNKQKTSKKQAKHLFDAMCIRRHALYLQASCQRPSSKHPTSPRSASFRARWSSSWTICTASPSRCLACSSTDSDRRAVKHPKAPEFGKTRCGMPITSLLAKFLLNHTSSRELGIILGGSSHEAKVTKWSS